METMEERVRREREAEQKLREMPITDVIDEHITVPFSELERRARQGAAVWHVDPSASGPKYGFDDVLVTAPYTVCLPGWVAYECPSWEDIRKSRKFRVNRDELAEWARRRSVSYVHKRGPIMYRCTIEFTGIPNSTSADEGVQSE